MNPKDLKYSKEHEWVKIESGVATVGITDFAQEQLTDVVFVELPEVGKKVAKDGNLGAVESVKSVSDIFSPVGGEVTEVNKELENSPELLNKDPYGDGWIAKLKVNDEAELDKLISAEEYEAFTKES